MTGLVGGIFLISAAWAQQPNASVHRSDAPSAAGKKVVAEGDADVGASRVYVHVHKTGLGHEHAVVGRLRSGQIHLNEPDKGGELVFDMRSFVADTSQARRYLGLSGTSDADTQREVRANMLGADVLDVRRFPTARFRITEIQKLTSRSRRRLPQYQLDGEFTLHGATRRIRVVADAERKSGRIHLRGNFAMLQTQFGMKPFTKMFGAVGVADRLEIWGDLWVASTDAVASNSVHPSR